MEDVGFMVLQLRAQPLVAVQAFLGSWFSRGHNSISEVAEHCIGFVDMYFSPALTDLVAKLISNDFCKNIARKTTRAQDRTTYRE